MLVSSFSFTKLESQSSLVSPCFGVAVKAVVLHISSEIYSLQNAHLHHRVPVCAGSNTVCAHNLLRLCCVDVWCVYVCFGDISECVSVHHFLSAPRFFLIRAWVHAATLAQYSVCGRQIRIDLCVTVCVSMPGRGLCVRVHVCVCETESGGFLVGLYLWKCACSFSLSCESWISRVRQTRWLSVDHVSFFSSQAGGSQRRQEATSHQARGQR